MSENTIQVNDVNEQKDAPAKEVELPVLNNEKKDEHGKSGCCGVCGGWGSLKTCKPVFAMLLMDAGFLVRKSHQHIISGCRMVLQKQGKNLQNGIVLTAFFDTVQFYLAANIRFSIFD